VIRVTEMWDRPRVRTVFSALAVVVFLAGLAALIHSRTNTSNAAPPASHSILPGSAAWKTRAWGAPIPLPKEAVATAKTFLHTAVVRRDLATAYRITAPGMHEGMTLAQWEQGSIPVPPQSPQDYLIGKFNVLHSRARSIQVETFLSSRGNKPLLYIIELVPSRGRWLVDYFAPKGSAIPVPANQG